MYKSEDKTSKTQKITEAIENKKITIGIFLDLSNAFDTVDHSILLHKLEYSGIRGITLKWFKSYSSDRKQIVKFYECRSSMINYFMWSTPGLCIRTVVIFIMCQ